MALRTTVLNPDGWLDFAGNGKTGDIEVPHASAGGIGPYQQGDVLFAGQKANKLALPTKWNAFARYHIDAFDANFLPLSVSVKLTAAADAVAYLGSTKFRVAFLSPPDGRWDQPPNPDQGGWTTDAYTSITQIPFPSAAASDAITPARVWFNVFAPTVTVPDGTFRAGDVITLGDGVAADYDVGTAWLLWPLAVFVNKFGFRTAALVFDHFGGPYSVGAPEVGIRLYSAHDTATNKPVELTIVWDDHLPEITSAPAAGASVNGGQTYTFPFAFTSSESLAPTWSLESVPAGVTGAAIDPNTGVFTWTDTAPPGSYSFTVRVSTTNPAVALFAIVSQVYYDEVVFSVEVLGAPALEATVSLEEAVSGAAGVTEAITAAVDIEHAARGVAHLELAVDATAELEGRVQAEAILE